MGLLNKLKNVLFEEEEVEIPVLTKTEAKPKIEPKIKKEIEVRKPQDEENTQTEKNDNIGLRNIKRDIELDFDLEESSDNTNTDSIEVKEDLKESPFLSFDEDEFEKFNSRVSKNESLKDSKKILSKENDEISKQKIEEPKKFRPSPVISPVYGILDKNYKKEDIIERVDNINFLNDDPNVINVDSVRKKAYGTLEDDIETTLNAVQKAPILDDTTDERSIDELLNDSIDDAIEDIVTEKDEDNITKDLGLFEEKEKVVAYEEADSILENIENDIPTFEEIKEKQLDENIEKTPNDILEKTNTLKILDDIENELNEITNKKEVDDLVLEDTRETDLFNLIDSMYENKDEEEIED